MAAGYEYSEKFEEPVDLEIYHYMDGKIEAIQEWFGLESTEETEQKIEELSSPAPTLAPADALILTVSNVPAKQDQFLTDVQVWYSHNAVALCSHDLPPQPTSTTHTHSQSGWAIDPVHPVCIGALLHVGPPGSRGLHADVALKIKSLGR